MQTESIHPTRALSLFCVILLVASSACITQKGVEDYNQGLSLLSSGKPVEAVVSLERARAADPTWVSVRVALGKAYAESGKPLEAWREFREALRLEPRNADAQQNLQRYWQQYRERGALEKGTSMDSVRANLGEPDSILDHYGGHRRVLWVYGRYGIEFRREKIYEIREQLAQ